MTNKEKILSTMTVQEICDDCLSISSGVHPRQTVYSICSTLSKDSVIHRHEGLCNKCRKTKLVNRLPQEGETYTEAPVSSKSQVPSEPLGHAAWYWEGNVQGKVVNYLIQNGYLIQSVADTASRAPGKDIIAVAPDRSELWISVKGYPEKSTNVQARHWFSGAVFDLILYRGENPNVKLALALPEGFVTYSNLLPRIEWLKHTMPFDVFWVSETGNVRKE